MEVKATAKYLRVSPQKARLVVDLIRGKKTEEALNILTFTTRASAKLLTKLLKSAIANAENNENIDVDTLYVKEIYVNGGPILKRVRPRAMGRASRIKKRSSHITIILAEK